MNELIAALTKAGAPLLGTLIGGPVGTLAGAAVGALAEALGTPATPEAITDAIKQQPGAEAIVRQVEADKAPGLIEAYLRDVQDARATTVKLVDSGSAIAWGAPIVSIMIVTGFLGLIGALLFKQVPDSQVSLVLFGTLSTAFGSVVSYWLGSSAGSARSGDAIRSIAQQATTPTAGQVAGRVIDAAVKSVARK
jgi:hypothetical protein